MADFRQIVGLRQRRADRAQREVVRTRQILAQASLKVVEAQQAVDDFLAETRTLEIDLLSQVLEKAVTTNDLLAIEEKLRETREKAEKLAESVAAAKQTLKEAGDAADAATAEKLRTGFELNKSRELLHEMQKVEKQVAVAKEDAELDEFCELIAAAGQRR